MEQIKNTLIKQFAEIVKPMVDAIEAKPETTRNHYGDYMALLAKITDGVKPETREKIMPIMKQSLLYAGANAQGVEDAYNLTTGEAFL